MKIQFIGTGSGKTSLKRFHSSILVNQKNFNLLVDAGDGISKALISQGIDVNTINAIIITHFHSDHVNGLTSLLTQMKLSGRKSKLKIYVYKTQKKDLQNFIEFGYIFIDSLDFKIEFEELNYKQKIFTGDTIGFTVYQNQHITNKYKVDAKFKFISLSLVLEIDKNKVLYSSDISGIHDLEKFYNESFSHMILETSHLKINDIKKAVSELDAKFVYLTHIDDDNEEALNKYHNSLTGIKSWRTKIAYDGLVIE